MKQRERFLFQIPKYCYAVVVIIILMICVSFHSSTTINSESIIKYYVKGLNELNHELNILRKLCTEKTSPKELKAQWMKSILQYKQLVVLVEYFNPYEVKLLNAPAINRVEPDNPKAIIAPHGFQLIEETLFQNISDETYSTLDSELMIVLNVIEKMAKDPDLVYKFKDETIFEAIRFSVIRLMVLDIGGFDSP